MAVTASGLFFLTVEKMFNNGAALNAEAEDTKIFMITNSATPNFDTHDFYNDLSGNEVSGTGYTAGGVAMTGTEVTVSSGTLVYDANDVSWTSSTITSARAAVQQFAAVANEILVLVNFGADYATSNGTFTIQWNASGIFTIDLTP